MKFTASLAACLPVLALAQPALDLSKYSLHAVYRNDFAKPQRIAREDDFIERLADGTWRRTAKPPEDAEWIAEGRGGVEIRGGKLRVAPAPFDPAGRPIRTAQRSHMVVWNRHIFPEDFLLEFDMSPEGSTNGLTIVFLCATGKQGEDIFDLALPPRRADYQAYHSGAIANYSDSYWSRNTGEESVTNRLRKNPGFALLAEGPSLTIGSTDVTRHVRILKSGAHMEIEINGHVTLKWDDPAKPLGAGRIGLRSMDGVTVVSYTNFKMWRVGRSE
jgi:Domain of unknown function (DUF1961)